MEMNIELRNIKMLKSMSKETACFTASLYIDGVSIGRVENQGCGGPTHIAISNREANQKFEEHVKSLPPVTSEYFKDGLPMTTELFVDLLLEKWEELQALKRATKKSTLFRLKNETYKRGEWLTLKVVFSPKVKESLIKKHGTNLGEIANESL